MTPRFDTNLFFATVDILTRPATPVATDDGSFTKRDPLKMYVPKAWLIEQVTASIAAMTANLRKATRAKLLSDDNIAETKVEIARRKEFLKQLRAMRSETHVYMAMHIAPELETVEVDDDADDTGASWN